jgi:hypothetical protein
MKVELLSLLRKTMEHPMKHGPDDDDADDDSLPAAQRERVSEVIIRK